jgi:hypothetical protein
MASIGESTKIFLQDLIEYACEGNEVLVKTNNLLFSTRINSPFMTWIVIYMGQRFSLVVETGAFDIVNSAIANFILNVDRKSNDTDNS